MSVPKTSKPPSPWMYSGKSILEECPILNGRTEFEQLKHFWERSVNSKEDMSFTELASAFKNKIKNYKSKEVPKQNISHYTLSDAKIVQYNSASGILNIAKYNIRELNSKGTPTSGGTSFQITTKGYDEIDSLSTSSTCAYRDLFDGNYEFCCNILNKITDIEVVVMNTEFTSFQQVKGMNAKVLETSLKDRTVGYSTNPHTNCNVNYISSWSYPVYYWLHRNKQHVWVENGCQLNDLPNDVVKKCYSERYNNKISVLGDSHMAYSYFYLLRYINTSAIKTKHIHGDHDISNFTYYKSTTFRTYPTKLQKVSNNILKQGKESKSNLLLLNGGVWELATSGPRGVVKGFNKYLNGILKQKEVLKSSNISVDIVWQSIPAFPYNSWSTSWWRNTHVIGALNYWMCPQLKQHGISCIDAWTMTLDWQNSPVCSNHMICNNMGEFSGYGGMAAIQKTLYLLCDDYL